MRILHISDIHFGTRDLKGDDGKPNGKKSVVHCWKRQNTAGEEESNPEELARILKADLELTLQPPDMVVATGDIGWSGKKDDYRIAREFFDAVKGGWPKAQIVILPGNHDVDLSESSLPDAERQVAFVDFLMDFYGGEFNGLYPFFARANERQDLVSVHLLEDKLLLVTVNSAAHLMTPTKGEISIAPPVLQRISDKIGELAVPDTALRMFALHHHLLPFAEGPWGDPYDPSQVGDRHDPTLVANSAKLQTWLAKNQFHLVLHGHKHVSHGREDILRKLHAPEGGHKLLVLGAGSAGVMPYERMHTEPLTFHVLDIDRMARRRWMAKVQIRQIDESGVIAESRERYRYPALELGDPPLHTPTMFCAERMDDCHRAIAAGTMGGSLIRNFISIVDTPDFYDVPTAKIGGVNATGAQVEESFRALHPEFDESTSWDNQERIDQILAIHDSGMDPSFQFRHGYRLFGVRGRARTQAVPSSGEPRQPIRYAVEQLQRSDGVSKAYVGLYDPDIDMPEHQEPIPGLMGVQFVPESDALDIVLTFRKIELSFWWVVNMLEASRLLTWAAAGRYQPRRITFFATLAQWKTDAEATFIAKLDKLSQIELMTLVLLTAAKSQNAARQLADLLREKVAQTNDVNFDQRGIQCLHAIVSGIRGADQWGVVDGQRLEGELKCALDMMDKARIARSSMRSHHLGAARTALENAVKLIETGVGKAP